MIEETLELWDEKRIRRCCSYWATGKDISVKALLTAFADRTRVKGVLLALPVPSAVLLSELLEAGETLTRSLISAKRILTAQELSAAIEDLQDRGLLFVFKNRMKLDNGMDRLELNELVRDTLSERGYYLGRPVFTPDELHLDRECCPDALSRHSVFGGILPGPCEEGLPGSSSGLVFDGRSFRDGIRIDPEAKAPEAVLNREHGSTLKGVLVVSALLSAFRKKVYVCPEDGELRYRDFTTLSGATGFSVPLLEDAFEWALECSLIVCASGRVILTEEGNAFLLDDADTRAERLQGANTEPALNGEESIGQLFKKWLRKRKLGADLPMEAVFSCLDRFVTALRRRWLTGHVSLVVHGERITAARSVQKNASFKIVPSSLLMTGGSEVHVLDARISPLQDLYLRAFGQVEGDGVVRTACFTEASIRRGLLLGFSGVRFLELIRSGSDREIPDGFMFTLEEWVTSFERVDARPALVLEVSDSVRELFLHDRELRAYYVGTLKDGKVAVRDMTREHLFTLLEKRHVLLNLQRNETDE